MKNTQNSNTVLVQLYMYLYPYDFMKHTQNSNTSTFPRNRNPHRSESEGKMLHQQGETQSFPLRRTRPIAVVVMNAAMKCLPRLGQTFRPFKRLRHLGRSNQFKLVQTIVCKRLTQPRLPHPHTFVWWALQTVVQTTFGVDRRLESFKPV